MNRVTASFLLVLLALPSMAEELTYAAARERLKDNPAAVAASAETSARREEVSAAAGLGLPRVEVTARTTKIDAPIVIDVDPIRQVILKLHPGVPSQAIPPFLIHVQDERFDRAAITATQPLYTGGKITAARSAAGWLAEQAEAEERGTVASLETDLVRRYFALRLASSAKGLREKVVAAIEQHAHHAKRLEEEGMIARGDRLHADVALAEAKTNLLRAGNDVELARVALASVIGDDDVTPASPLFVMNDPPSREELKAAMLADNPVIQRLHATREAAGDSIRVERSANRPTLYAFGSREILEEDLTILDPKWAAGVGFSYTLFEGRQRDHKVAAATDRVRRVEALEEKARRDLGTLLDREWFTAQNAAQRYRSLEASLELAKENVRIRELGFAEGVATSLDVVDAQLALSRVELERLAAAYEFDVALASLLEVAGRPEEFVKFAAEGQEID